MKQQTVYPISRSSALRNQKSGYNKRDTLLGIPFIMA